MCSGWSAGDVMPAPIKPRRRNGTARCIVPKVGFLQLSTCMLRTYLDIPSTYIPTLFFGVQICVLDRHFQSGAGQD